jgi:hypothetical protein
LSGVLLYGFEVYEMLCRYLSLAIVSTIGAYASLAYPLEANAIGITSSVCYPVEVPYKWNILVSIPNNAIASTDNPTADIIPIGLRQSKIATQDGHFTVEFVHNPPAKLCADAPLPQLPNFEGTIGYEVGYKWNCPQIKNPNLKRCGLSYTSFSDMTAVGTVGNFGDPMRIEFFNKGNFEPINDWIFEGKYSRGIDLNPIQAVVGGRWTIPWSFYTIVTTSYSYEQNGMPTQEDFSPAQSQIRARLVEQEQFGMGRSLAQQNTATLRYYAVPGPLPILGLGVVMSFTRKLRSRTHKLRNLKHTVNNSEFP